MKITNVEAIYPQYRHPVSSWRDHFWQIVVRVETDVGITGYGFGGGGVGAVEVVNRHFASLLSGRVVNSIEDIATIWDDLYQASLPYGRRGIAVMALSGLDLALWDLLGRAEKMPVYQLIGTRNIDQVQAYASGNDSEYYAELGYTAHKFTHRWTGEAGGDYASAIASAEKARKYFGDDALLMVDCYMSWDATVTIEMEKHLAPYKLYWIEDILTPDQLPQSASVRAELEDVHLAGGEHEFTHFGFAEVAHHHALDIWQPDITWCGGITAGLRIVELASQANIPVVLHRGGEVWGLHLIVSSGCDNLAEWLPGTRPKPETEGALIYPSAQNNNILWYDQPEPANGFIAPTDAPGFGVNLNETFI